MNLIDCWSTLMRLMKTFWSNRSQSLWPPDEVVLWCPPNHVRTLTIFSVQKRWIIPPSVEHRDPHPWAAVHFRSCQWKTHALWHFTWTNLIKNQITRKWHIFSQRGEYNRCWLVVSTPLKNISQLGWLFPIYAKIKNVPNHQPGWDSPKIRNPSGYASVGLACRLRRTTKPARLQRKGWVSGETLHTTS